MELTQQEIRIQLLNSIRKENKISLKSVYMCMEEHENDIDNMDKIFDSDDDLSIRKRIVLLKLISRNRADENIIKYYLDAKNYNALSNEKDMNDFKILIVTALRFNTEFFVNTCNWYGFIQADMKRKKLSELKERIKHKKHRIYPDMRLISRLHQQVFASNKLAASYRGEPDIMTDELSEEITKYTDAFNANPNDYDTCIELVLLYMQKGSELEKAVEYSNKALDIREGDPLALYARSLAYYKMGKRNPNVLNDLQAFLEMDIQSKEAYYAIGRVYLREKEDEKAREAFEKCKAIDPDFSDVNERLKLLSRS